MPKPKYSNCVFHGTLHREAQWGKARQVSLHKNDEGEDTLCCGNMKISDGDIVCLFDVPADSQEKHYICNKIYQEYFLTKKNNTVSTSQLPASSSRLKTEQSTNVYANCEPILTREFTLNAATVLESLVDSQQEEIQTLQIQCFSLHEEYNSSARRLEQLQLDYQQSEELLSNTEAMKVKYDSFLCTTLGIQPQQLPENDFTAIFKRFQSRVNDTRRALDKATAKLKEQRAAATACGDVDKKFKDSSRKRVQRLQQTVSNLKADNQTIQDQFDEGDVRASTEYKNLQAEMASVEKEKQHLEQEVVDLFAKLSELEQSKRDPIYTAAGGNSLFLSPEPVGHTVVLPPTRGKHGMYHVDRPSRHRLSSKLRH